MTPFAKLAAALLGGAIVQKLTTASWIAPLKGKIVSRFGMRDHPIDHTPQFHNGVDIDGDVGDKIVSPRKGNVYYSSTTTSGGLQLFIRHDNGWVTGYAHLSKLAPLYKGQAVKAGQLIAYVGKSGRVTGPHLHFTLTDDKNVKQDPEKFIKF
jgi:murein DD-endopeptidase MepM/ murein hydrolase activator NlpD